MPRRPKKPCAYPGCPELVSGQTYCDKHVKKVEKRRQKRYDSHQRNEKLAKFYSSSRWQKVRDKKLKHDPLCKYCKEKGIIKVAECVDHIVPVYADWSLRLTWSNLASSCTSCNVKKGIEDRRKYGTGTGRGGAGQIPTD